MTRLSELARQQLEETVQRTDAIWAESQGPSRRSRELLGGSYVAYIGATAIAAGSAATPGTGTVTLKELGNSGDWQTIIRPDGSDAVVDCYNYVEKASGTNRFCIVTKVLDSKGRGIYVLSSEAC